MNIYRIPEENIDRLDRFATRIKTKCAKYGCDFHYAKIDEAFDTVSIEGIKYIKRFIIVECEGIARINDWEFVGTIDFTENGNIIRSVVDVNIPDKYRHTTSICEHCNTLRSRKNCYLVRNIKTNEFKQVGKSCLKDFTGGLDVEAVAALMSAISELEESQKYELKYCEHKYYRTSEVLAHAYNVVRDLGYVSASKCEHYSDATKVKVLLSLKYSHNDLNGTFAEAVENYYTKFKPDFTSDKTMNIVNDIIKYVNNLNETSDYIRNIKIIAKNDYVSIDNIGCCVSIIPGYNRYISEKANAKENHETSTFQGSIGDKLSISNPKISVITSWPSQYGGYVVRLKIVDENNNIYMWDCTSTVDETQPISNINGTVKKHDSYNGVNQTWLTRCKVTYAE